MSLNDNYESPYEREKANRSKVNVNLWYSQTGENYEDRIWYIYCIPQRKCIPKDNGLFCPSCGNTYPIVPQQQYQQNKLASKFQQQNKHNTIIATEDRVRGNENLVMLMTIYQKRS